ncbi:MAG: IS607 family transposase [Erysipelotrichaceae bacterium]|nr:IS607 family transposase [Erysipelotrichaceae bacterium]MCI9524393.1 IS607 family transposase [Erysipelotrichaceae bacterium]
MRQRLGYYRIGEFAKLIGKSTQTLRNWDRSGVLKPERVERGRKYYSTAQLDEFLAKKPKLAVGYCRVNGHHQKAEMERQVEKIKAYMIQHRCENHEIYTDYSSGLRCNRNGFKELIYKLLQGEIKRIVVCKHDTMMRYGVDLVYTICQIKRCDLVILEEEFNFDDYCSDLAHILHEFDDTIPAKRINEAKNKVIDFIGKIPVPKKPRRRRRY